MPSKPTTPYGYINFGADGTVQKVTHVLPAEKEAQEKRAAEHFLQFVFHGVSTREALKRLPECDNDFKLLLPDRRPITLELVELASREYMFPINAKEWLNNSQKYPYTMQMNEVVDGKFTPSIFNIDLKKKAVVLTEKIQKKLRYAKPTDSDFWLLIWTCESEVVYAGSGPNGDCEDAGVKAARKFALRQTEPLFDEIWITNMIGRPHQIFSAGLTGKD